MSTLILIGLAVLWIAYRLDKIDDIVYSLSHASRNKILPYLSKHNLMTKEELINLFIENCNERTAEKRKYLIMNQYQINTRELIFDNNSKCLRIFRGENSGIIQFQINYTDPKPYDITEITLHEYNMLEAVYDSLDFKLSEYVTFKLNKKENLSDTEKLIYQSTQSDKALDEMKKKLFDSYQEDEIFEAFKKKNTNKELTKREIQLISFYNEIIQKEEENKKISQDFFDHLDSLSKKNDEELDDFQRGLKQFNLSRCKN